MSERSAAGVPRTTQARNGRGVAVAARRRVDPPAAFWGMVVFVASEATLLGCLVGSYFYLRFHSPQWPPAGIPEPRVIVPMLLAVLLAATSVPVVLAMLAARRGRLGATRFLLVAALLVQCGYIAYELHDYGTQLDGFGPDRNAYASIYYTLLGADHAHVLLGILFELWLLWKLARGFTTYRVNAVQNIAVYWVAVGVITLAVIGTLSSAAA